MADNELDYDRIAKLLKNEEDEENYNKRKKKSDWVSKTATALSLIAWVIMIAVWVVLDMAAPDRVHGWLSFFEVQFGTTAAFRARWNYPLVYTAYVLLLVSLGSCMIAFVLNKMRMRRKSDKYKKSIFVIGGITVIAFVVFLFRFGFILF
jgi:uncharacterized membrane protein YgcG